MAIETYALYVIAFGGWAYAVHRAGGIGVGFRFLYAMYLAMFFLVGPLLGAISGVESMQYQGVREEDGVLVSLVGLLSFLVGAYWLFPQLSNRPPLEPAVLRRLLANPVRLESQYRVAWVFIVCGILALPLVNRVQAIPTLGAVLGQTTFMFDTGMAMLCLYYAAGGKRQWYWLAAPLFLVRGAIFAASSGHSGALFIHSLVFACLALFAFHATLPRFAAVAAMSCVILIPASMWLNGRERLRDSVERQSAFSDRFADFVEIFSNPQPINVEKLLTSYRGRGDFSSLMAGAVSFTPAVEPYALGESFLDAGYAIVPRILWPNKPIHAGGNEFVSQYTGIPFDDKTSVAMSHMFEFYVNFGVPGVVVGMVLIGILMGWMEALYCSRGVGSLFVEYTLIFVNWTVTFYADRSTMLAMTVIPALALCWIVRAMLKTTVDWPYFNHPVPLPKIGAPNPLLK